MSTPVIEVLWRPGCPYCNRLRRDLARAGVVTVAHDIWADPGAAARVREVTGGDETVPTVVVGDRALVNPRLTQVVAAVREQFPDDAATLLGRAGDMSPAPEWREGAFAGAAVAVLWVLLAGWRPETQWHLAPFLAAAAPPWLLARRGELTGALMVAVRQVAVASSVLVLGLTGVLWALGLLRGPVFVGAGPAGLSAALVLGRCWGRRWSSSWRPGGPVGGGEPLDRPGPDPHLHVPTPQGVRRDVDAVPLQRGPRVRVRVGAPERTGQPGQR